MSDKPKHDKPKRKHDTPAIDTTRRYGYDGVRWLLLNAFIAMLTMTVTQWAATTFNASFVGVMVFTWASMVAISALQAFDLPAPLAAHQRSYLLTVGVGAVYSLLVMAVIAVVIRWFVVYFIGVAYGAAVGWRTTHWLDTLSGRPHLQRVMGGQALAFAVWTLIHNIMVLMFGFTYGFDTFALSATVIGAFAFAALQYYAFYDYLP